MGVPIQAIRIESHWNGSAIPARHWITIHLLDQDDTIEVRVRAPHYGSPPPPSMPVGPTDSLWEHEVVELFIFGANGHYTEIELAPTGHYLVLQLDGIRNPVRSKLPIAFSAEIHGAQWTGIANIPKDILPNGPHRINATAIHGEGTKRTYLSWTSLPGPSPDFHQPSRSQPLQFHDSGSDSAT